MVLGLVLVVMFRFLLQFLVDFFFSLKCRMVLNYSPNEIVFRNLFLGVDR